MCPQVSGQRESAIFHIPAWHSLKPIMFKFASRNPVSSPKRCLQDKALWPIRAGSQLQASMHTRSTWLPHVFLYPSSAHSLIYQSAIIVRTSHRADSVPGK